MLRTPLHDLHRELGARMVEFAGYEMPVMYTSIVEEHLAVRNAAGIFDVSHMGNLWVRDDGGKLSSALVCDASAIREGGSKYTCALREDGTILDDLYVFRLAEGLHLVPNAGMHRTIADHISRHAGTAAEDVTDGTCILAVQGPKAQAALQPLTTGDLVALRPFRCGEMRVAGGKAIVTRTGYTGEDGFEVICAADQGPRVFRGLLSSGAAHGLRPCGLGARDTLRLEKGFCLAGHEFAGGRTPLEAGLERLIHWDHEFVGKKALEAQRASGSFARLVGLLVDQGVPRQGSEIAVDGRRVGEVSSGTMSPVLKKGIALGYVPAAYSKIDTRLQVITRGSRASATVARVPFV